MQQDTEVRAGQASPSGVESAPPAETEVPSHVPSEAGAVHALWDDVSGDSMIVIPPPSKAESALALKARTYYRRKEEKEELERELAELEEQLEDAAWRGRVKRQREEVAARELFGQAVRGAIHSQRVAFANTMSHISEFLRGHDHNHYEPTICLGSDPEDRYAKLLRLKPQRLQVAVRFLRERQRFMCRTAEFCDLQRFVAANGDHCLVRFDVMPIPDAASVEQAFDAVLKFTYNLEIAISTLVGNVTLRENEDVSWNSAVAQHRLVTSISDHLEIDTNNVTFAEYSPDGRVYGDDLVGKPIGVTACNYVNEDGMYPYNTSRLRQDITFFVQVSSHALPGPDDEEVVMLSRWTCFRIRKPSFDVTAREMKRSRDSLEQVGNAMLSEVLDACQPSAT